MSLPRLLAGWEGHGAVSLATHELLHGPRPPVANLFEATEHSGLRGRGGASFPVATKLRSVAAQRGPRALLVNVAEGEPLSQKDRVLLECVPHLVLDGALAAAGAVDAGEIVVAIRADAAVARTAFARAVDERRLTRKVQICDVPVAYLAGQEGALIRHLNGGPLRPAVVPPRPFQRGLKHRPTLVHNPETLAHLALIARRGAGWFRQLGTNAHPGSALTTVCGAVTQPGVQEISCGAPLSAVLAAAGGPSEPLRAVLVGGFHGTWIDADAVASVRLDDEHLARFGGTLAAGVIVALGATSCPVQELAQTLAWMAGQSAQQCGPCANGLPALAGLLAAMAGGRAPRDCHERLQRWCRDVSGRGACHLPDGAARFLQSGSRVFAAELADHAAYGACEACVRPTTLGQPA
jgi:NADH:ubiquinone oxidoreductase subunit F (NADH-binding)